jgi:hypothetical protein
MKAGQRGAVVTAMYKQPGLLASRVSRPTKSFGPSGDLLGLCGELATALPHSVVACANLFFNASLGANDRPAHGTHGEVFGPTGLIGQSLSSEIGVDLCDAERAIAIVAETANHFPYPGLMGLRYVRKSDALLAFARFDTTCMIELTGAGSPRTRAFYDRVWAALHAADVPFTQHWGKVNNASAANVAVPMGCRRR